MTHSLRARWAQLASILALAAVGGGGAATADAASLFETAVSIDGERFLVNGVRTYQGTAVEGLLLNSRMVQAAFDDENPQTVGRWAYPDTGVWDAERNTREFVAAVPTYARHGLRAVTVGLQGGRPLRDSSIPQNWIVSAFTADGSLKAPWLERLARVIEACDANGIVVIVSLFYKAQDHRLRNEVAVVRAVDGITDWLLARQYTNVLVEIGNETNDVGWDHEILRQGRIDELISRVQQRSGGRLKASTSFTGGYIPPDDVVRQADFVLVHGNHQSASGVARMVDTVRAKSAYQQDPKPIVFNEDSASIENLNAAVGRRASWGYHDPGTNNYSDGFQSLPINWTVNTASKRAFFDRVAQLSEASAPSPPATGTELLVSSSADRSTPVPLDGRSVGGNIYVFATADTNVTEVSFYLDDPTMSGAPRKTELSAPFDFAGTATGGSAHPFDTRTIADGQHTITADISFADGTGKIVQATFAVANDETAPSPPAPTSHTLLMSAAPDRSSPIGLEGRTVAGTIYVFSSPETGVAEVRFYLDDQSMSGSPRKTELNAPFDFAGTNPDDTAKPFDTRSVADGQHTITAAVRLADGTTVVTHATFVINNV